MYCQNGDVTQRLKRTSNIVINQIVTVLYGTPAGEFHKYIRIRIKECRIRIQTQHDL